ncbi:MAG: hypothetical protein DIKNOCCD_01246 [bacterium]|nr:hypothetical protein [bacterium]
MIKQENHVLGLEILDIHACNDIVIESEQSLFGIEIRFTNRKVTIISPHFFMMKNEGGLTKWQEH